jgi:hypothetical protein
MSTWHEQCSVCGCGHDCRSYDNTSNDFSHLCEHHLDVLNHLRYEPDRFMKSTEINYANLLLLAKTRQCSTAYFCYGRQRYCNLCEPGYNQRQDLVYRLMMNCSCDSTYITIKTQTYDGDGLFSMLPNSSSIFTNDFRYSWQCFFQLFGIAGLFDWCLRNPPECIEVQLHAIYGGYYDVHTDEYVIEVQRYDVISKDYDINMLEFMGMQQRCHDKYMHIVLARFKRDPLTRGYVQFKGNRYIVTPEEKQKMTPNPLLSYFPKKEQRKLDACINVIQQFLLQDIANDILQFLKPSDNQGENR